MEVNITLNLLIRDINSIKEEILRDWEEITDDSIREYFENYIEAHSKNDAFEIEGGDCDGWLIQNAYFNEFKKELENDT